MKTEMIEAGIEIKTITEFRIQCKNTNMTDATIRMAYLRSSITAFAELTYRWNYRRRY